jgi:hypothetical protein
MTVLPAKGKAPVIGREFEPTWINLPAKSIEIDVQKGRRESQLLQTIVWRAGTQQFLCNRHFQSPVSSLSLSVCYESSLCYGIHNSSTFTAQKYREGYHGSVRTYRTVFKHHAYNGLFALFFFFLSFDIRERQRIWSLNTRVCKCTNSEALYIVGIVWNIALVM